MLLLGAGGLMVKGRQNLLMVLGYSVEGKTNVRMGFGNVSH